MFGQNSSVHFACLAAIISTVLLVTPAGPVWAIDKLLIRDADLNPEYLPYELEPIRREGPYLGSEPISRAWQVVTPSVIGHEAGRYFSSYNMSLEKKMPAIMGLHDFPIIAMRYDTPVNMTIRDWQICPVNEGESQVAVITGFRKDSAFIIRMDVETGAKSELYLYSGTDEKGNGIWEPEMTICLTEDYDYDRSTEVLVWVNSIRECSVRELFCVNLEPLALEWSLPVAPILRPRTTLSCRDSLNPAIILTAYNPRQGYADENFSDLYAYLARIDYKGQVVFKKILARNHLQCRIVRSGSDDVFYLFHEEDLRDSGVTADSGRMGYFISRIDCDGNLLGTTFTEDRPYDLWLHRYGPESKPMIHVEFEGGFCRVYNDSLDVVAQSDSVGHLEFLGRIKVEGVEDSALVFGSGIYSADLTKLANFNGRPNYFQVLGYDEAGNATSLIANPERAQILNLRRRPESRLELMLSVFYMRNQKAILAILSGLMVGLLVMNYYRRRMKSDLRVIASQRDELRRTHKALQEAQKRIIEQEKYRQAKSIAGGFAHEIRNALFPAEAAFAHLGATDPKRPADPSLLHEAHAAVERAIDITELISRYTRLDAEHEPEPVNLGTLIREALDTHHLRIEELGVKIVQSIPEDVIVKSNQQQLRIVLTNLLVNSLDALTDRELPHILLTVEVDEDTACLVVEDNGKGIDPDCLPRIFDAFFSTKPNTGTGLGLATTKKIVESYGGSIVAESHPNEWTRFRVRMIRIR